MIENYFYESHPDALKEIELILNEMEKCFEEKHFFATILLCGAINERLLNEKLIGHSKVKSGDKIISGADFFDRHKEIFVSDDNRSKEDLIKKQIIELHGKTLNVDEKKILFSIYHKLGFRPKTDLGRFIGMGQPELDKINEINKLRVKYFHPFKLSDFNALGEDAEKTRNLT